MIKLTPEDTTLFHTLRLQLRTAYIHAITAIKGPNAHNLADMAFTDLTEKRLSALFHEAGKVLPEGEGEKTEIEPPGNKAPAAAPSVAPAATSPFPLRLPSSADAHFLDSVEEGIKSIVNQR